MPPRYLLINPNASTHITERMAASARAALVSGESLRTATADGEPAVVRSRATLAQADRNAEAMLAAHAGDCDAVVLGISLDGAAPALRRQRPDLPIVGMTEAALMSACLRVERVGLLTLGAALVPLYAERVAHIGLSARVAGIEAPEAPAAFAADTTGVQPQTLALLADAGRRLQATGAQAVVLAGAVLCGGYAGALAAQLGCPVYDGVACAIRQARSLLTSDG